MLTAAVLAAVTYIWIRHVPAALPILDRIGVLALLDISPQPAEAAQGDDRSRGRGAVQVVVTEVEARAQADRVTAIGDGRALRSVTLRAEVAGRVMDIGPAAGSRVEEGDLIVQLDDEDAEIALERARITLEDALAESERVKRLRDTGAVTEVRAREAELLLRTSELNLRQAEYDLGQRRIVAPISGWVGIVDIDIGDRINAQDPLITITDRSAILIEFQVPERVIGGISVGMPVELTPLGLRGLELSGVISAIDTVVDRASRTLRVQARVENSDDLLRVGMAFQVALVFPGETLLSVSPLAVQWSSDGAFVWAVRDGKAARVPVVIRQRNSDDVLVEAELENGEVIVIEGVQNLRPGSEVVTNEREVAQRLPSDSDRL